MTLEKDPWGHTRIATRSRRDEFTGQIQVFVIGDAERHDEFCQAIIESLKPETHYERTLANGIAEDQWRLDRARAIDLSFYSRDHLCHEIDHPNDLGKHVAFIDVYTFCRDKLDIQALTLVEQRIHRTMERNLKTLRELQKDRKAEEREKALEEAVIEADEDLAAGKPDRPRKIRQYTFTPYEMTAWRNRWRTHSCVPRRDSSRRPQPDTNAA